MKKMEENERNRRWDKERQEGSDGGEMIVDLFKVPTAFREIWRRCVKQDPEVRPSARRVALDMEKLYADVERGRVSGRMLTIARMSFCTRTDHDLLATSCL